MDDKFKTALDSFFAGCQHITNEYFAKHKYQRLSKDVWQLQILQKRARIIREGSAHCFVDLATGDVLKPAGFNAPAKHARGNIFDADNGLGAMGPYGPAYLR